VSRSIAYVQRAGAWTLLCAVLVCAWTSAARAQRALSAIAVGSAPPRIDGALGDWRGVTFRTIGDDAEGSLDYALGYDAQALYFGARVYDDALVRSREASPREDALVLTLAMPRPSGAPASSEVWLFAGIPGAQAASAAIGAAGARPARSTAVTIVEGPLPAGKVGYALEARVPWSALEGGAEFLLSRAALRMHDVDGKPGTRPTVHASARAERPSALPPLLCEAGPNAAIDGFLRAKGLSQDSVRHDLFGDAGGDARLERVVLAGTFAVIAGAQVEAGAGYRFHDLPVTMASSVRSAELRDLTGDGKTELLVRLRQQNELGARELFQVIELSGDKPRLLFAAELQKETEHGAVAAELDLGRAQDGKPPAIELRIGSARGLDARSYREQRAPGVEPILLPWGEIERRVYRWDGARFAVTEERPNRAARAASPAGGAAVGRTISAAPARVANAARTVHRQPPGADELVAAFREARGIDPAIKPRFVQHANVAEDGRIESLMLFGKDLLVIGKGYRGGTGYFYYSLPVGEAADIQRVFTGDVTGDRRRELFVRFKQRIGDVEREILLGYTFSGQGVEPIVSVEVRRAQGERSVGNVVALVPAAGHWALRVTPGKARAWDARSYPFVAESSDGYGPLLLPWKDAPVQYHFDGQTLIAGAGAAAKR
jgi:hypothetical protein